MEPFTSHTGIAAPFLQDDVNTDQIAPLLHSHSLKEDYRAMLFARARYRADGSELGAFDSIYVVTREDGHWGVKARSSFAP